MREFSTSPHRLKIPLALVLSSLALACTGTNIGNPARLDDGSECNEELTELSGDDAADLGSAGAAAFSADEAMDALTGEYTSAFTWRESEGDDAAVDLRVKVTATGPLFLVGQTQKEQGDNQRLYEPCPDTLRFAATVEFETSDGLLQESVATDIEILDSGIGRVHFSIDTKDLTGDFEPDPGEVPEGAKNEKYTLSFSLELVDSEASGEIHQSYEYEHSSDDKSSSGGGAVGPLATFSSNP